MRVFFHLLQVLFDFLAKGKFSGKFGFQKEMKTKEKILQNTEMFFFFILLRLCTCAKSEREKNPKSCLNFQSYYIHIKRKTRIVKGNGCLSLEKGFQEIYLCETCWKFDVVIFLF